MYALKLKYSPLKLLFIAFLTIIISSCKEDKNVITTIEIEDPLRFYHPIIQGDKLEILVSITNTGDKMLYIKDVLPSCGCTIIKKLKKKIPPKSSAILELEYNSTKNIGDVEIETILVTNTKNKYEKFKFKINVVPDSHYIKDYEELYSIEKQKEKGFIQKWVDGDNTEQTYMVDSLETKKYKKSLNK